MTTNTFDHISALNGARVWCGDQDVTHEVNYFPDFKTWCGPDEFEWDINGQPKGGFPPLTTKPESDE